MNAPQRIELMEPADAAASGIVLEANAPLAGTEPQRQLSVIEYAVKSGASVAEVRTMMELQVQSDNHQLALIKEKRLMDKEDREAAAKLAYKEDFAKFKLLNIVIPKSKRVVQRAKGGGPGPRYDQTEMEHVSGLLSPALAQNGFSFRFDPVVERKGNRVEWVSITCHLEHRMGYSESVTMGGPPDDGGAKNVQQEVQSTVTFWSRHTLLAVTGTPQAGMDNDGRGARGYEEDDAPPDAQQQAQENILQTGRDESLKGTAALNAWWGKLNAKQRNELNSEFGALRRGAAAADAKGAAK